MFEFDYLKALYRRDNKGNPCVWAAEPVGQTWYEVFYGQIGKTITKTIIVSNNSAIGSIESAINEKRKKGYKFLSELKDNNTLPVEEELLSYLNAYLPVNRTTADGSFLAMLAKTFDNENNKLFKKNNIYYGQWKINGLRCSVRPYKNDLDLFDEIHLDFQSREGIHWNSLKTLEEYLLTMIPKEFLEEMIDNNWALDGEVYLPNYSVNDINHFVKDSTCQENKLIQFWCYDLIADDIPQKMRFDIIGKYINHFCRTFKTKNDHYNNKEQFLILPLTYINDEQQAFTTRDSYIDLGFEGLIMRNPEADYQFGKRNSSMIKFKKSTDGKFLIVDIKPEGIKRPDIPLFVCKNDINSEEFECHVGGTLDYQKDVFKHKDLYIGKYMYVEYGERAGVKQVPFHVKHTHIIV